MNKKKLLIALILIIATVSIGVGLWTYFSEGDANTEQTTQPDDKSRISKKTDVRVVESCQNWYAVKKVLIPERPFDLYLIINNISASAGKIVYLDPEISQTEDVIYSPVIDCNTSTDLIINNIENVTYYALSLYRDNGDEVWNLEDELIREVTPVNTFLSSIANKYVLVDENLDPDTIYWVVQGFHLDTGAGKKYQYEEFSFVVEFLIQKVGTSAPEI